MGNNPVLERLGHKSSTLISLGHLGIWILLFIRVTNIFEKPVRHNERQGRQ